jgi:hypothetical protein
MFKGIMIGTVSTLLSSLVVAIFISIFNTPRTSHATASYDWIDIPNPTGLIDLHDRNKFKEIFNNQMSFTDSPSLDYLWLAQWLKVVWIDIKNPTNQRANNIEISISNVALWYVKTDSSKYFSQNKLSIESIDPGDERVILAFLPLSYSTPRDIFSHQDIPRILEDGRSIVSTSTRIDDYDDPLGVAAAYRASPFLGSLLFIFGLFSLLLIIVISVFGLYMNSSLSRRARLTSRADLQKMRQLIAYIDNPKNLLEEQVVRQETIGAESESDGELSHAHEPRRAAQGASRNE